MDLELLGYASVQEVEMGVDEYLGSLEELKWARVYNEAWGE